MNQQLVREKFHMSFKSKAIGIIAGTALALSIASGTMAQNSNGVSVTLINNDNGGVCSATLSGNYDLGDWVWNGFVYQVVDGSETNTLQANVRQTIAQSAVNCTVTVFEVTPLTRVGGNEVIAMNYNVGGSATGTKVVSTATGSGSDVSVGVTTGFLNDKPAGNYLGSVSITAGASSN
jgi:hypothetical protein